MWLRGSEQFGYMSDLNRIKVGNFEIQKSIKIDELKNDNINNFISVEEFFNKNNKIILNSNNMIRFLNGVKLNVEEFDGIHRIYNQEDCFIGIGIVNNNVLKRDIII